MHGTHLEDLTDRIKPRTASNVLLWVDKASGALMRMEGYDWNTQLVKRFEVVSAQKIEGRWFLKQMRIEQLQPGTNHVQARAYLEIKR